MKDILLSLLTGVISSALVVLFFEYREYKRRSLSRAHILERFSRELFGILTVIRAAAGIKLENSSFKDKSDVLKELERVLGRYNPSTLMGPILNLSPDQHKNIFMQLTQAHESLSLLFTYSIGHKTIEDDVSASIAEMQEWIDSVLQYYVTFPEIINRTIDETIQTMWMTSIFNLVENSFAVLTNVLKKQNVSESSLRWGSRSKA